MPDRCWFPTMLVVSILTLPCARVAQVEAAEVEAVGSAPGNVANAREQALTDALREAVRQGTGVNLVSQTKVTDYVLDYDRVFAASFGYVKGYNILEARQGADGLYRVRIRAEVAAGNPDLRDELVLRQIVQLKQSPRVALEIDEQIEGVKAGTEFAKTWFEQAAQAMQLQLVDIKRVTWQQERLAERDRFLEDQHTANLRRADFAEKADFILQVRVRGKYLGQQSIYGSLPQHHFSLTADLRAIVSDTGNLVATVPLPGQELFSSMESTDTAARELVHRILAGNGRSDSLGATALFRRMFTRWIAELDLGTLVTLEFASLTDSGWDRLQKALGENPKISAVFPRKFDGRGLSKMEVESRLDTAGLKMEVLAVLGPAYALDHATKHYLGFVRTNEMIREPHTSTQTAAQKLLPLANPLAGAGTLALLSGLLLLFKK